MRLRKLLKHELLVMPQVNPEVISISTIFYFFLACLANGFAFVELTFVHISKSRILTGRGFECDNVLKANITGTARCHVKTLFLSSFT